MEADDDITLSSDIEDEDISNGETTLQPWDPSKIRITTKNFSLREIFDQIKFLEIDLNPDFQREFVWKQRQRTRLIESILLGIPLPAFYFNQDEEGRYQVVDGVQRLSTIYEFMNNKHTLQATELEYLFDLNGRNFESLDPAINRRFRSAQIVVHIIEPQTPDEVKYDIFNRVNTLGSPLSAQEIRHAMSKDRSRKFLFELTTLESFNYATASVFWKKDSQGQFLPDSNRMMNRELALRFCAFSFYESDFYKNFSSMNTYLVEFLKWIDDPVPKNSASEDSLRDLYLSFDRAMMNSHVILGNDAFRRYLPNARKRAPINRAIFEAQSIALAPYSVEELLQNGEKVRLAILSLFDDDEYTRSVTVGTGSAYRIEYRLYRTQEVVRQALDY
ncbi:DUF262 domain-containing protein [Ectopseudomonas oleovorans]|uniref:Uncharacterized protein DUF262 n=1 Tax=Ectopseudomonas oleovorans TaxID=301 RepID=A0A3D9EGB7_ECTOL|nr:DUF262 domain-containing protein [Pseudomonas oleovorans]RED02037.1 uncharacterized protein DUF262 [Pseudomonas oleovorans]